MKISFQKDNVSSDMLQVLCCFCPLPFVVFFITSQVGWCKRKLEQSPWSIVLLKIFFSSGLNKKDIVPPQTLAVPEKKLIIFRGHYWDILRILLLKK